ncbi:zinc-binding dehydrogenase [Candidatus Poribacteria bacterium]|nr:zinc-binding dehydrogenase [Candidatus Poribacteria bacterium]MYG06362.1 zinc-binding dehydrogenase [Candidatus Poribacteria bacterium]MYK23898.1 zinc-binding dehydrogenase [Candidatus Poribacteria bacterium]
MQVAAMFGDQKGGVVEKPDPRAGGDIAVVKIHAVPMCTEYKGFIHGGTGEHFGHEAAGEVVEVAQPGRVKVGDRVVVQPQNTCGKCQMCVIGEHIHCMGGSRPSIRDLVGEEVASATYAQYMHKMEDMLCPIPDDVSYEHAGMACCGLGPTFGAMEQMQVNSLDTVMVTGLGPVGLGGIINAHYRGARVIGVESHPYRAELAKKLGAEVVLDPSDEDILDQIRDLTDGVGIDKAVDCSGASAAHRLMVDAARRKGQVTFVGEGGEFPLAASRDMIRKGLILRGNWHYNLGVYPKLMKVIQDSPEVLDTFITHTFPMRDVQKAWELQATGECGKVILHPWE